MRQQVPLSLPLVLLSVSVQYNNVYFVRISIWEQTSAGKNKLPPSLLEIRKPAALDIAPGEAVLHEELIFNSISKSLTLK